jgi:hypothetical protein
MKTEELSGLFKKYEDDFLEFDKVKNKRSKRPDLHAFLLLENYPIRDGEDIISAAEHDEIWLGVDVEKFAEDCTEYAVLELRRCGIMYDEETESFHMFA